MQIKKVGILGAGYIAESHIKALKNTPYTQIITIHDKNIDRARKLAAEFNIGHVADDIDDMLKLELDCIHVLLPPDFHYKYAKKILENNVNVFVEKPMCTTSKQCLELSNIATKNDLLLGVNHNFLFLPSYEKLAQTIRTNTLGRIDQATINWFAELGFIKHGPFNIWMLDKPENIIFEIGSHTLAIANDMFPDTNWNVSIATRKHKLPNNKIVYQHFNIIGQSESATIHVNLSLIPGYIDKSVYVKGSSGIAVSDYEKNIFYKQAPSGSSMLFDNFLSPRTTAKQILQESKHNFINSIISTLRKSPNSTPFGLSIQRSVEIFYKNLEMGILDSRHDPYFGTKIIQDCEKIRDISHLEQNQATTSIGTIEPDSPPEILVIGGTGFIGKKLVRKLTEHGYSVRVHTRDIQKANIELNSLPVELVTGKLYDTADLNKIMEGIKIIYYLAKTEGSKWEDYVKNDINITRSVAETALANNIKHFIYTGTIDSFYSANPNATITSETPIDKKIKQRNLYARSKAECESLLHDLSKKGLIFTILRPGIVIGEGSNYAHWGVGMWNSQSIVQFWGDGKNKLPFVLVDDVADALVKTIECDINTVNGKSFNICDEPMISAREYVHYVEQFINTKIKSIPTPIWKHYINDLLKNLIKFLIHHPNARFPTYRDWDSRSHRAHYDCKTTREALNWNPSNKKEDLINIGIKPMCE